MAVEAAVEAIMVENVEDVAEAHSVVCRAADAILVTTTMETRKIIMETSVANVTTMMMRILPPPVTSNLAQVNKFPRLLCV